MQHQGRLAKLPHDFPDNESQPSVSEIAMSYVVSSFFKGIEMTYQGNEPVRRPADIVPLIPYSLPSRNGRSRLRNKQ